MEGLNNEEGIHNGKPKAQFKIRSRGKGVSTLRTKIQPAAQACKYERETPAANRRKVIARKGSKRKQGFRGTPFLPAPTWRRDLPNKKGRSDDDKPNRIKRGE